MAGKALLKLYNDYRGVFRKPGEYLSITDTVRHEVRVNIDKLS